MRGLLRKYGEILEILIENQKIDILSLTGLFVADTAVVDFNIQRCEFIKRCRKNGNGGGVGASIRNDMIFNIRQDWKTLTSKESGLKSFQNLVNSSYSASFASPRIHPTTGQNTSEQSYWKKLERLTSTKRR